MRHTRIFCLPSIAALLLCAAAASPASAKLPEWGQCRPTSSGSGGKFANSSCTQPVKEVYRTYTGGYEWHPLVAEPEEEGETPTNIKYGSADGAQPSVESDIVFADGSRIKCSIPLYPETKIYLNGATFASEAPYFEFGQCVDSRGNDECISVDAENFEAAIGDSTAWRHGLRGEPSWDGTMSFISGKQTPEPSAAMVYKTAERKGRFLQQVVCEGSEPLTFVVGGHKAGEELTMAVTPVNVMSSSFTATMSQNDGMQGPTSLEGRPTRPLEALVNAQEWESVGFEASMYFPAVYLEIGYEVAEHEARGEENHAYVGELELKATP